ncbi:MAG: tetratricopeptide repeat protein, partial [Pseudomonadota bacterium]
MLIYAWWALGAAVAAILCVGLLKALFEAPAGADDSRRWAAGLLIFLAPVAAVTAYLQSGDPTAPDRPLAATRAAWVESRTAPSDGDRHVVAAALAERAHAAPYDVRAWLALADAYRAIGRFAEAVQALERARALEPNRAEIAAALAASRSAIDAAPDAPTAALRAMAPDDAVGRYLIGLEAWRRDDPQAALASWLPLMRTVDAAADWGPALRERVEIAALALGRDAVALDPRAGPRGVDSGPAYGATDDASPPALAEDAPPEAQLGLIRSLAADLEDRLRATTGDVEGWRRLARAYQVLGEPQRALAAFASAADAGEGRPDV